jgi:hypothetical protein
VCCWANIADTFAVPFQAGILPRLPFRVVKR